MKIRRYLIALSGALLLSLGAVFAFNLLVDPFGCYGVLPVRGFNEVKTRAVGRVAESIAVLCADYDTLIFGTSRTGAGYPKDHPAWKDSRFFDFTFQAALVREIYHALERAHGHHPIKRVMIGLDFFMFNDTRLPSQFYNSFLNPARRRLPHLFDITLSLPSTKRSFYTLKDNFNPLLTGLLWEAAGGRRNSSYPHRRLFQARTKDYLNKTMFYGRDSRRTPEAMEYLRRIVALARREGIDLRLVINPPHAMMMEVIRYRGFWAEYEDWKRDLVRVAHGPGGAPVPLIDFSGYNAFTTGDVPGADQPQRRMRWHMEITHFNRKMGAEVLNRVYAPPGMEISPAGTFGVRLTPANVESHLAAIRAERHAYVSAHPTEMGWLKQLAR